MNLFHPETLINPFNHSELSNLEAPINLSNPEEFAICRPKDPDEFEFEDRKTPPWWTL